ncbi:hypothetical protein FACS189452_02710 [Bacteroidia bacterium]|nr:hypothetical protein FACS189452_02710 [Bacteroidia bacterium]
MARFLLLILVFFLVLCKESFAAPDDERNERKWSPAENKDDLYEVKYDENANNYSFYQKNTSTHLPPVKVMDKDEYRKYQFNNDLRQSWVGRRNTDAAVAAQGGDKDDVSRLIPPLKLNSQLATTLLGSDVININLQGNIELLFGYKWSRTDNPTIPEEYRSHGILDFDVKYQLNATGQIGNKIKVEFVSGSDANYSFQDRIKISYMAKGFGLTPDLGGEDDIIQSIEAGNVSLPLSGSLITGSQTLFGFRTDLKFGKVLVETIISQQKGESSTIDVQGGAQATNFEVAADKYDANRHFFLSHYFRENYNNALKYLPLIQSGITITRLEVWITNKNANFETSRNIIALDLDPGGTNPPNNKNNSLYNTLRVDPRVRDMSTVNAVLAGQLPPLQQARDFEKIENARRLNANEYSFHPQLGYISLNMALNNDEVLAVAYEYTSGASTRRVGEFYDEVSAPSTLLLKMLKGTNLSPRYNTWKLMMKNVYSLDAYQLNSEDFTLNVMYKDDELGTYVPYLTEGKIKNEPLLSALNLDNSNAGGSRFSDGKFDFVEGVTVQSTYGRIIFPVLEPFGRDLAKAIDGYKDANGAPPHIPSDIAKKYAYNELYDSTLVKARQLSYKNKFKLSGRYKSSAGAEIILGAVDIPQGSVVVTAGGIQLVENVDYTVNYSMGRVKIINPVYMGSNVPLKVSVENMSTFSMVNKTLMGANVKYNVNKQLKLGGTILHLSERPLTQKVGYGDEPISNTIWGLNGAYQTDVPFLTKWVDALPLLKTKVPSKFNFDGEFAHFLPGHSSAIGSAGSSYIDDFEAAQLTIDLKQYTNWFLGSTPQFVSKGRGGNYFTGNGDDSITNGYQRSLIAWYTIDPTLLRNSGSTPAHIKDNPKLFQKNHYVREIAEREIFPKKDKIVGANTNIPVLNVAYYPRERGSYNYTTNLNPDGTVRDEERNFGAISRALPVTDFENSNIEFIEFWLLDPFIYNPNAEGGKLVFNLGDVSEDVLRDKRKSFENGIPYPYDEKLMEETPFGRVPKVQSLTNTFDNNSAARQLQDVGLDGIGSEAERTFFEQKYQYLTKLRDLLYPEAYNKIYNDPSNDDYHYYRGDDYDRDRLGILERYKRYNQTENNSPLATGGMANSATTMPNTEDLNKDNTLNELESYYEYMINLSPRAMQIGSNYISDIRTIDVGDADYGDHQEVRWFQFKIPVRSGVAHNNIEDFKSMKFMRMFLTGFTDSVVLRFAKFELMRGDWRKYEYSLVETQEGTSMPETTSGTIDISAVSIEENAGRSPVNYILPPGVSRVIDNTSNQQYQRNEQSLMLTVKDLASGDSRATYKAMSYDMRNFRRLQMDVHAEAIYEGALSDNDLSLFVRVGSDLQYNYYEYEIPLRVTPHGIYNDAQRDIVWYPENRMDIELQKFTDLKKERNRQIKDNTGVTLRTAYDKLDGRNMLRIVGNPNLGEVREMMIGVRNPSGQNGNRLAYSNTPRDGIVWVNELRLNEFEEGGGWAATGRVTTSLADFGTVSFASSIMTAGFGGIDTRVSKQRQEQSFSYDLSTQCELGKFFPDSLGVSIPFGFAYSETFITPKYNPLDPDILYKEAVNNATDAERKQLEALVTNYAMRKNFTFNNLHFTGGKAMQRLGVLAPGNFTAGYAYSESLKHDINVERDYSVEHKLSGGYAFTTKPFAFAPFKASAIKTDWFKIIKDFNLNLYPGQYGFSTVYTDTYNEYITRGFYEGMVINPIIWRERTWDRNYTLGWDITSNLKFNFNAVNNSRQDISMGREADSLVQNTRWRNTHYGHDYTLAYTVPINKLPALSWTNTTLNYRATYDWDAAPMTTGTDMPDPGNAIRNSNNFQGNLTFNFTQLYNKSKFLKGVYQEFDGRAKKSELKDVSFTKEKVDFTKDKRLTIQHNLKNATGLKVQVTSAQGKVIASTMSVIDDHAVNVLLKEDAPQAKVVITGKAVPSNNPLIYAGKFTLRTLMMLKNANFSYTHGGETSLSGYTPQTKMMGFDMNDYYGAPGYTFILGSQSRDWFGNFYGEGNEYMLTEARRNGWLIDGGDTMLVINPFTMRNNTNLTMRISLEPFRDLRIDLNATQTQSRSRTWYGNNSNSAPTEQGSFSTSTISIGTAFENAASENYYESPSYTRFKEVRREIAQNLAQQRFGSGYAIDGAGFPVGYGGLSQDVMIPAFSASYLGKSVKSSMVDYTTFLSQLPLPNWQVTYSGLSNIKALKQVIKSANLTHSYKSIYTIGNFATNTNYLEDTDFHDGTNDFGDFYTQYSVSNVSLTENIVLGGIDITWLMGLQTRFEVKKNRRVELSMSNNQIIENNAWEGTIGGGYTTSLPQIFSFEKTMEKANFTLRADFTLRDDKTVIRKLAEETTQITDGKRNMAVKFTADYLLLKDLTFRLYFDWMRNNPYVSAVNTANWAAGFSLRYVLGM